MVEVRDTLAVMGNHEFNAIAYHTRHPEKPGEFMRSRSEHHIQQHEKTLQQVPEKELAEYLTWFRTLPLWLELEGLEIIHACWDEEEMKAVGPVVHGDEGFSDRFLHEAAPRGGEYHDAIEVLLKGKEMPLPPKSFRDKGCKRRSDVRIRWFESPEGKEFRQYAFPPPDELASGIPIPEESAKTITPYPKGAKPVFFGHYWLKAERPTWMAPNVACVDYSVAAEGCLCAYQWDGEQVLDEGKFVTVDAPK
jgi:hypothetical protein